jgi:hypothetical protein
MFRVETHDRASLLSSEFRVETQGRASLQGLVFQFQSSVFKVLNLMSNLFTI